MNTKSCGINFSVEGTGAPLVFLHGYLESNVIWKDFSPHFINKFKAICIDLPGHGQSFIESDMVTMEDMAIAVKETLLKIGAEKCVLVGHSMGGYVALAFADLYPEMIAGLVLLHSHPLADSPEKARSRIADMEGVANGQKSDIVDAAIPKLYADENVHKFSEWVMESKRIAMKTPDRGMIAALRGMSTRKDRSYVIEKLNAPVVMIFGKKDNLIALGLGQALEKKHTNAKTVWLENSGHMGFIEERDQAANAITSFLTELFDKD